MTERLRRLAPAIWILVVISMLAWLVGSYPLMDPDEGRNAEVAREMAATGDLLVPHLDGLPYMDKPFLYFAVVAAGIRAFGSSELVVRLPSLLATLLTIALVGWFARRLYGSDAAWIAAGAALVMPVTLVLACAVIFDATMTLFMVTAIVAFYRAVEHRAERRPPGAGRWLWTVAAWAAMALGVMTKGPVALVVPLLVAVPYGLVRRASAAVWHPAGPLAFTVMVAPWLWATERAVPGFLHYALVTETWSRMTSDELRRTQPVWYLLPVLFLGSLPWSLTALAGWVRARRLRSGVDHRTVFLLLWLVLPLVMFSLSRSKQPHYVLPLVPAVALLLASLWREGSNRSLLGARLTSVVLAAIGGAALLATVVPAFEPRVDAHLQPALPAALLGLGSACLVAAGVGASVRVRWEPVVVAFGLPLVALLVAGRPLLVDVARGRSTRSLAAAIAQRLPPDGQVVGIHAFPHSLAFYLERPILVSTADGGELTSNYVLKSIDRLREVPGSPLRPADWWRSALTECPEQYIFVTSNRDAEAITALTDSGLPLIVRSLRYSAYGPCAPPVSGGDVAMTAPVGS